MQAYRAYYQGGRIVPLEKLSIPDGSQIIVTVLEESPGDVSRRQKEAMARFREEIRNCNEPVTVEFERVRLREIEP